MRVIRVHYDAHETIAVHGHPKTPAIYVYLANAGPIRFKHRGTDFFELQRRAVKRGALRLSSGRLETHEVENASDTPNDFLRVELNTVRLGAPSLTGRFAAPTNFERSMTKVEFEDANVRIVRVVCAPQGNCEIAVPSSPALEIIFPDSPEKSQVRRVTEGPRAAIEKAMHLLRIEFRKR